MEKIVEIKYLQNQNENRINLRKLKIVHLKNETKRAKTIQSVNFNVSSPYNDDLSVLGC